jgi:tetratricopeptide (TPR) repeat protein
MARGDLDLARKELQTALRIYPDLPNALAAYGLLEFWEGHYQEAGRMMEKALLMSNRDNTNYDFMAVNLAGVLMKTGQVDAALELLNRQVAEAPAYARGWSNRAVIHYERGNVDSARSDASTALRLDPQNAQAAAVIRRLDLRVPPGSPLPAAKKK